MDGRPGAAGGMMVAIPLVEASLPYRMESTCAGVRANAKPGAGGELVGAVPAPVVSKKP